MVEIEYLILDYCLRKLEKIYLQNITPNVFAQRDDLVSDVWRQNLVFEKGKLYLVEAASGTGKSTLCSYIIGYRSDFTGKLLFDNRDVKTIRDTEWVNIRQRHISHLFQELRLFPELTAWENVLIKNQLTHHADEAKIRSWFDRLGIADRIDTKVAKMSFGQQQRVAMIRALVQPFDFILVDEPVSHLDEANSRIMGEIMLEESRKQGAGIIVTSIGKHMALQYDKVIRL